MGLMDVHVQPHTPLVLEEQNIRKAGKPVYLAIKALEIQENHKFAISSCWFINSQNNDKISLIAPENGEKNSCQFESLNFMAYYDHDLNFKMSFDLFLFTNYQDGEKQEPNISDALKHG